MAQFRFHLIGNHQAHVVEVCAPDVQALAQQMSSVRFIEGKAVEPDEAYDVIIAVHRVQFVVALSE